MTKERLEAEAKKVLGPKAAVQVHHYKAYVKRPFVSIYIHAEPGKRGGEETTWLQIVSYEDTKAKACDKAFDVLKEYTTLENKPLFLTRRYKPEAEGFETQW